MSSPLANTQPHTAGFVYVITKQKLTRMLYSRLLDVLLDVNNRPQIPTEKRFNLSLPLLAGPEKEPGLPIDKEPPSGPQPTKSLRDLIADVPHLDFATTAERFPDVATELLTGIDSPAADASHQQHPPSFLTADDIDNYLWEIDVQIAAEPELYGELPESLATLAPLAREQNGGSNVVGRGATPLAAPHGKDASAAGASNISTSSRNFALRNPTSVYNWLRKHAPKTFLQDHEGGDDKKEKGGDKSSRKPHRLEDDDDEEDSRPAARKGAGGSARKASGEGRASIGAGRAKAERSSKGERASKRSKASVAKDKRKSMDETMYDVGDEAGYDARAGNKGKRKRAVDDDTGYRPKGGSSRRPAKKRTKNNSLGGASGAAGEDKVVAAMQAEVAAKKKEAAAASGGAGAEN